MNGKAIEIIENDGVYFNTSPKCEPQLGRRGLYASVGGDTSEPARRMAMLWVLNLSDGKHTLLDIAERANLPFSQLLEAVNALLRAGLLDGPSGYSEQDDGS